MTPALQHDEQTRTFTTAGQRVRYRVRGDGPPLLMLHGLGLPLELWQPLEPELTGFQTITVDVPGTGGSSTPDGRFRMPEFAAVMDDLLSHLHLPSASVLGLSLGGMIAQELAHRSPHRVDRLVLASTSCGWNPDPTTSTWYANTARHRARQHARRHGLHPNPDQTHPEDSFNLLRLHDQLRHLHTHTPSLKGLRNELLAAWTWSSHPWLHTLTMPTLVLHGSEDGVIPVANGRLLATTIPNARLEIFQGATHLAVLKHPTRAAHHIRHFLDTT